MQLAQLKALDSLGPAELAIASDAYQAAIALVGVDGYQEAVREALAHHIMDSVLSGARDVDQLRDGALRSLNGTCH